MSNLTETLRVGRFLFADIAPQVDSYTNLPLRLHAEIDLTDRVVVDAFFHQERLDYVSSAPIRQLPRS